MAEISDLLPDRSVDDLIADRDVAQEMADLLAEAVGRLLGVDVGEHSSENDPWGNALDAARSALENREMRQSMNADGEL